MRKQFMFFEQSTYLISYLLYPYRLSYFICNFNLSMGDGEAQVLLSVP